MRSVCGWLWARIAVGLLAWGGFLAYVLLLGRRAAAAGETGDLDRYSVGDTLPSAVG